MPVPTTARPATRPPTAALALLVLTLFSASACSSACYPGLGGYGSSAPAAAPDRSSTFTPAAAAGGY